MATHWVRSSSSSLPMMPCVPFVLSLSLALIKLVEFDGSDELNVDDDDTVMTFSKFIYFSWKIEINKSIYRKRVKATRGCLYFTTLKTAQDAISVFAMKKIAIRIRRLLAMTWPARLLSTSSDVSDICEWLKYKNKTKANSVAPSDPNIATLLKGIKTTPLNCISSEDKRMPNENSPAYHDQL